MSGTISTADRPVYELTEGELIIADGQVETVIEVVCAPELEATYFVAHTGPNSPLELALTDTVACVVGW